MQRKPKIAIHTDEYTRHHSSFWTHEWIRYCENNEIDFRAFDFLRNGIISILSEFDIVLWHFSHYDYAQMQFARSVLDAASRMGLQTFPEETESRYFDDKVSQSLILQSIGAPIPRSHTFFSLEDVEGWLSSGPSLPVVAKLKGGSGSQNVRLISSRREARVYASNMLSGRGFHAGPDFLFKARSNIGSTRSVRDFVSKAKRIPEFLGTLKVAGSLPRERGYVYFQEFVNNDGFDLKIVTLGDKASFLVRNVRAGDFRASGGGSVFYERALVTPQIVKDAFAVSHCLGARCMGYDFVVDRATGQGKIIEMSYGFSHSALMGAGGYWMLEGDETRWVDEPLNAPIEILNRLINQ